jgi:hypothetical protein
MAGAQRRKCKCCHKLFRPVLGYLWFLKTNWDDADKFFDIRMIVCEAMHKNNRTSLVYAYCMKMAADMAQPEYDKLHRPWFFIILFVYAVMFIWTPYSLIVAIKWVVRRVAT